MSFSNGYVYLSKYFTDEILSSYPLEHYFFQVDANPDTIKQPFFEKLDEMFSTIESIVGEKACSDYVKKLIAKTNSKYDVHAYNSAFSELLVLYIMAQKLRSRIVDAEYEPTPDESNMCSEFKFSFMEAVLNVEVKALDFSNSYDQVFNAAVTNDSYIFKEYVPVEAEELVAIAEYLKKQEHLDLDKMAFYKSELSKINNQIKNANKKFSSNEKYNVVFVNYNAGLHPMEVIKVVLDSKKGILVNNSNMSNIDALVILSLSQKCYSLEDVNHALSNAIVLINPTRNLEVEDFLRSLGFNEFHKQCEDFPDWDIYKIVMLHDIKQYVVVPYWQDEDQLRKDVIEFIT